jgi:hypothetical protein
MAKLNEAALRPEAFQWPKLPDLPAPEKVELKGPSFAHAQPINYFTEHQMQGYANAYGEAVRAAVTADKLAVQEVMGFDEFWRMLAAKGYRCDFDRVDSAYFGYKLAIELAAQCAGQNTTPQDRAGWIDANVSGNPTLLRAMKNIANAAPDNSGDHTTAQTVQSEQSEQSEQARTSENLMEMTNETLKGMRALLSRRASAVQVLRERLAQSKQALTTLSVMKGAELLPLIDAYGAAERRFGYYEGSGEVFNDAVERAEAQLNGIRARAREKTGNGKVE